MISKQTWDFHPEWLEHVKRTWKEGIGRVQQVKEETPETLAFKEKAREAFIKEGIKIKSYIKTYISIQKPEDGDGYAKDYPHIHYPLDATTLVHYLEPGDKPAPLDIFDGDTIIETIYPKRGLTVFMPNDLRHGVRKNNGTTDRIQLIATAL